jgi:hypothetical protein
MMAKENNDPLVTKEGIRVCPGQLWRDLDKRMGNRVRRIEAIVDTKVGKVRMVEAHRRSKLSSIVSVRRMHKHSTGWELVNG